MTSVFNVKKMFDCLPKDADQIELNLIKSLLIQQMGLLQLTVIERGLNLEKDKYGHSSINQEISGYVGNFIKHNEIFDYLRNRVNGVDSSLQVEYKKLIDIYEESFDALLNLVDGISKDECEIIERIKALLF